MVPIKRLKKLAKKAVKYYKSQGAKNTAAAALSYATRKPYALKRWYLWRNKHYDVGIFGWWYNYNYGAIFTYFALNRAIQSLGKSVVMLWRSSARRKTGNTVQMKVASRYYNVSYRVAPGELQLFNKLCDAFILGSDQLWNPSLEKVTGKQFYLSFVDNDRVKLAYAQSFGDFRSLPEDYTKRYGKYARALTKVSVREDYAVNACLEGFGIDAEQVCDPVFLIEPEQFGEMLQNASIELPQHYVLNFLLNPNAEKMRISRRVRQEIGIPTTVNFTDLQHPEDVLPAFEGEKVEVRSEAENLLKAYKNADYVVTDSFHGTCLSIIFNKPFISIANKERGTGRFHSLLRMAKLEDRLIYNEDELGDKSKQPIDYDRTNAAIREERRKGMNWLREGFASLPANQRISK